MRPGAQGAVVAALDTKYRTIAVPVKQACAHDVGRAASRRGMPILLNCDDATGCRKWGAP